MVWVMVNFSPRDWRVLLRAAERYRRYLVRRAARPSSHPDGADARALERISALIEPLTINSKEETC